MAQRLFLPEYNRYLDLDDNTVIAINISVAEVQDIGAKDSSFTKDFTCPQSKNNDELLGMLFDINSTDNTFNYHRKVKAIAFDGDVPQMNGYMKLKNITQILPTAVYEEEKFSYLIAVYDEVSNLFTDLGDELIEDLDVSEWNHNYTALNILATSAHTVADGYTYSMKWNQNAVVYTVKDFTPDIYIYPIVKKMIEDKGYQLESPFMRSEGEDTVFRHLLIPNNQSPKSLSDDEVEARRFRVSITGATNEVVFSGTNVNIQSNFLLDFNDDTNGNLFDNDGGFNTSTATYVSPYTQNTDFIVKVPITYSYNSASAATLNSQLSLNGPFNVVTQAQYDATMSYRYTPRAELYVNGAFHSSTPLGGTSSTFNGNIIPGSSVKLPKILSAGTHAIGTYQHIGQFSSVSLNSGDTVQVKFQMNYNKQAFVSYRNGSTTVVPKYYVTKYNNTVDDTTLFYNIPNNIDLQIGQNVNMNLYLPKQLKKKDLLSFLCKKFNLFIWTDDENEKKIYIGTRDEYYDFAGYVDWSENYRPDKLHPINFLVQTQAKNLILTDKLASDEASKTYNNKYEEVYGQQKYIFDDDLIVGEKKIDTGFESTPLVKNGFNLTVPYIASQQTKTGLKILYKPDEWIGGSWKLNNGSSTTYELGYYPYAGHFDSPVNPTLDINMGQARTLFIDDYESITENTAANKYYKSYVDQIIDGKILTAYFDLNSLDISNINLRKKVKVRDTFYVINKIVDFIIDGNQPTKVELLKFDYFLQFQGKNGIPFQEAAPSTFTSDIIGVGNATFDTFTPYVTSNDTKNPFAVVNGEFNNVSVGSAHDVKGSYNNVFGQTRGTTIGDFNSVDAEKSFIFGDGSVISGASTTKIFIVGDNCGIGEGVKNAIILGDGISATTDDTVYVNNLDVAGSINGIDAGALLMSGDCYVKGYHWEREQGNTITLGKALGKMQLTNGSVSVSGISGADFFANFTDGINNSFEATVILEDGTRRYIVFSSVYDETNADIDSVYSGTGYSDYVGPAWDSADGEYDFYGYFLSDARGAYSTTSGLYNKSYGPGSTTFGATNLASASFSTAIGIQNQATGFTAFAGGIQTKAYGSQSTTFGWASTALGATSFAIGYLTNANGINSFVGGSGSTASGNQSFAFGHGSRAIGENSQAFGFFSTASAIYSFATGLNTQAIGQQSSAFGSGSIAFGDSAMACGQDTTATGLGAFSEGYLTDASGTGSHAEGIQTSTNAGATHAQNDNTQANAYGASAEGGSTIANGTYSHTGGYGTRTYANASRAIGYQTSASTDYSFATGFRTWALGSGSTTFGSSTIASGIGSIASGSGTTASGDYSFSSGFKTSATTLYTTAEGESTIASAIGASAKGLNTQAIGIYSSAKGVGTIASGQSASAEGNSCIANGPFSSAEGNQTESREENSHSEGNQTLASGKNSHSEGSETIASGLHSHSSGWETLASGLASYSSGYNTEASGSFTYVGGASDVAKPILSAGRVSFNHQGRSINSTNNGEVHANYGACLGGSDNGISSSGLYSAVVGGLENVIFSATSFIGGGQVNKIMGNNNGIIAGGANVISGGTQYSFQGGGIQNTIDDADYSAILGGTGNTLTPGCHQSVIAGGYDIEANLDNTLYSANRFNKTVQNIITTGSTAVQVLTYTPAVDGIYLINCHTTAIDFVSGDALGEVNFSTFKVISGVITEVGVTSSDKKTNFPSSVKYDIITDGTSIFVKVIGKAATTITWRNHIEITL